MMPTTATGFRVILMVLTMEGTGDLRWLARLEGRIGEVERVLVVEEHLEKVFRVLRCDESDRIDRERGRPLVLEWWG